MGFPFFFGGYPKINTNLFCTSLLGYFDCAEDKIRLGIKNKY